MVKEQNFTSEMGVTRHRHQDNGRTNKEIGFIQKPIFEELFQSSLVRKFLNVCHFEQIRTQ